MGSNLKSKDILSGPDSPLKRALISDIDKRSKPGLAVARCEEKDEGMNKTEKAYSLVLEDRIRKGELILCKFEALKLRLADRTFFTPDFMVVTKDNLIQFHEVKAMWGDKVHYEDDARVKIKVAAEQWRVFQFIGCYRGKNEWVYEEF